MNLLTNIETLQDEARIGVAIKEAASKPLRRVAQFDHHGASDDSVMPDGMMCCTSHELMRSDGLVRVYVTHGIERDEAIARLRAMLHWLESTDVFGRMMEHFDNQITPDDDLPVTKNIFGL